jgi:hypothetical protein
MCRAVRCRVCDKTTWSGCGAHVAAVKRSVSADQWCTGHAHAEPHCLVEAASERRR